MKKHLWMDLTWLEFDELNKENVVVIVPVGSIEQHGPHLPVSTDTKIVTEIATHVAKHLEGKIDVLVTPTVWSGFSPHHMDFSGSITLSAKVLLDLLIEICSCIYKHGFRRILLLNGHGGNTSFLRITSAEMRDKPGCIVAALSYWELVKDKLSGVIDEPIPGHAGEFETSLQLVLSEDLVNCSLFSEVAITPEIMRTVSSSQIYVYRPTNLLTSNGAVGNSKYASVDKGQIILRLIIKELGKLTTDFSKWDLPD